MIYCSPDGEIRDVLKGKDIEFLPLKKMSLSDVKRAIDKYQPDIIHAHDFRASFYAAMCKKNQKLISHLHNNPPFIQNWNPKTLLYFLSTPRFDNILVVSNAVLKEAIFFNKKNKDKVTILNNCINKDDVLERSKDYEIEETFDISFVGRLSEQKNPLKILNIIKRINELKPGIKAVIVGDGEMRKECEIFIKTNGLDDVVIMKGFQKNPFPYLKNSKVSLMPSIFEGFGLVAIESMVVGTPVLNSGVGGLATIFENDSYFICDDIEEYAQKAIEIIDNNKSFNLSNITERFTDMNGWKKKIINVYTK